MNELKPNKLVYAQMGVHQCWTCRNMVGRAEGRMVLKDVEGIDRQIVCVLPECKIADAYMTIVYESPCSKYACFWVPESGKYIKRGVPTRESATDVTSQRSTEGVMSDIVERLRDVATRCYNGEPLMADCDLLNDAADEIEKLRDLIPICETVKEDGLFMQINKLEAELEVERKKHEWISVKDRLPDEQVLSITKHKEYLVGYLDKEDITHWMNFPEPPKEKKNEKDQRSG